MSYPYGRRERITLVWEDASKSSKVNVVLKGKRVVDGSQKHCAEEIIRWLCQKGFINPFDAVLCAGKIDFTLYAKIRQREEQSLSMEKSKIPQENSLSI